jgi:hypothetical protein
LSAGVINGFNSAASLNEDSAGNGAHETLVYVGTTLATPVTGLKVGAAMDFSKVHSNAHVLGEGGENDGTDWAWTLYGTYQATEKLSFSGRGEFVVTSSEALDDTYDTDMFDHNHIYAFTATAQYDLWQNVVSRVEFRWDHAEHYRPFGNFDRDNAYMLALNLIYQF